MTSKSLAFLCGSLITQTRELNIIPNAIMGYLLIVTALLPKYCES
jgi:hypothetical protein